MLILIQSGASKIGIFLHNTFKKYHLTSLYSKTEVVQQTEFKINKTSKTFKSLNF